MTGLDLVTAESQEANDTHVFVVAQGSARTAELALKRLLVTGPDDPLWRQTITPADRPDDRLLPIDLEAALRRALAERTDVAEARQQAAANDATLGYLREQIRPQADLVASLGLAGLGGAQLIRAANGGDALSIFSAPIVGTTSGTYFSALGSLGTLKYPTWSIALNFSYPIGYSAAKAEAARAEVQAKEAATQTRQIEVQVVNDVTAAAIDVRNTFDEITTARQASEMAARRLDAEQKKFTVGLSTSYLVVEAQRNLGDARRAVLRAEIAYQKALVEFDRAQQTTLQSAGVTIVTPAGVGTAPVGSGQRALPAPAGSLF
jgi:outer membrane protein TolC